MATDGIRMSWKLSRSSTSNATIACVGDSPLTSPTAVTESAKVVQHSWWDEASTTLIRPRVCHISHILIAGRASEQRFLLASNFLRTKDGITAISEVELTSGQTVFNR
ncbi:unnamed protein product [Haemonchus placei]|uniref:Uncharacterized protein n=1 Tax=Haemonchus placei TaxID=6290 RepID=A0A0N4WLK0_HAEPC|nr:unnamed protein product [Haemonchus placei]